MRYQTGFPAPTPQVTTLLIIIIAIHLAFAIFGNTVMGVKIYNALVLDPAEIIHSFQIWRLLTYGFLHDTSSPMHIVFNALMLYMVGPQLEEQFKEAKFFMLVISSIIMGGLLVCLMYVLGLSYSIVVGFSAATMGMLIAWGLTFQNATLYFFGLLPLTGLQLVYVTFGLEVLYAVSINSISSAAHFGGMLSGLIFAFDLYKPAGFKRIYRTMTKKNRIR